MPTLDFQFWLGLALAIPLSIAGNLLTPRAQQFFAKRSETKTAERIDAIREELMELEETAKDPARLPFEMLRSVLFITFLGAFFGVFSGTLAMLSSLAPLGTALSYSAQVSAILGGVMVMKEAFSTLIRARNVKFIDKHREVLQRKIAELERGAA